MALTVPGVELGHHSDAVSFDSIIRTHGSTNPALEQPTARLSVGDPLDGYCADAESS